MKRNVIFLFVIVAVIECVNSVSPVFEDGSIEPQTSRCDYQYTEGENIPLLQLLINGLPQCINLYLNASIDSVLTPGSTKEEYRIQFKEYCSKVPSILTCNGNITFEAQSCLNFTEIEVYDWHRDLTELLLRVFCHDDGERLATALGENVQFLHSTHKDHVKDCFKNLEYQASDNKAEDFPATALKRYRLAKSFRGCVVNIDDYHTSQINSLVSIGDEILSQLQCVGQPSGFVVICEQLDKNLQHE